MMIKKDLGGARIQALVDRVLPCERVIDVGCDHGYTSMGLARREDIGRVLATDISAPSLAKLKEALKDGGEGWKKKITCVKADGLQNLPWKEADALVISGMGGSLVRSILEGEVSLSRSCCQWVLSPQSDLALFRTYLTSLSYEIREDMVEEGGKFYTLFDVRLAGKIQPGYRARVDQGDPFFLDYGPSLLARRDPVLLRKMRKDLAGLEDLERKLSTWPPEKRGDKQESRLKEVIEEKSRLEAWLGPDR